MKKTSRIVADLWDGYQSLGEVILSADAPDNPRLLAYLDGYADAMHQASWWLEEQPPKSFRHFDLLRGKRRRKAVRKALAARRSERRDDD